MVVGSSMGGFTALHMALRRPDLVGKLVLVGTSPGVLTRLQPIRHQTPMIGSKTPWSGRGDACRSPPRPVSLRAFGTAGGTANRPA